MVNKLWYQVNPEEEDDEELIVARNYIQSFIDLYFFDSKQFKVVEDITTENLGEFLEVVLNYYERYQFHLINLSDLAEAIHLYFHRAYMEDFPDTCFPYYNDKRQLALDIIDYVELPRYVILPEDIKHLIAYLHTSSDVVIADKQLIVYLEQFNYPKRFDEEEPRRWEAICKERIEAIKNNKPLPIRPMSIELDPCYKEGVIKKGETDD